METSRIRLAEVLTSLAVAIDLGLGVPMQTVLRTTLIGGRLARAAGIAEAGVEAVYYLSLLRYVGCTTTAHESSQFLDELALGELLVMTDEEVMPGLTRLFGEATAQQIAAAFAGADMGKHQRNHCEAGELIAKRLGLAREIVDGLTHTYERWDGRSNQQLAQGEAISLPMRIVQVAYQAGQDSTTRDASEIGVRVQARAGKQLDPKYAALFAEDPEHFLADVVRADLTEMVLDAEPGEPIWLAGEEIDRALSAVADFGDLKSPHMLGHSRRVAKIAVAAARAASLPASDVAQIGQAALIHDVGRIGVQSSLLSKPGDLTRAEHERIRLHSYLTGRIFADSPALAPIGALGSAHHERLDGSGYHRGLEAAGLSAAARLLAAANAWCALVETRPHRPQMTEAEAASALSGQAKEGLFDRNCVDAVLTAVGQKGAHSRRSASIALSEREIEVLRLVSRELTNPAIAEALGISPKTVERHVTHIYDKIGVSSRAGAALYALESGLI